jgi:septation ring formation regulator EzrA
LRKLEKLEAEIGFLTAEIAEKEREYRVGQEAAEVLPKLRKRLQQVGLEYAQAVTDEYSIKKVAG